MFSNIYENKRVLITGHTGFKGSWLALWLSDLGAKVAGYALPPPTEPSHFQLLGLDMASIIGDIRDTESLKKVLAQERPEIIFHLAAQPIVRLSYQEPVDTMATNVMGTAYVLDACRRCSTIRAIVIITSDKCYENKEWPWGYRESDPLGGYDPYSASKGCAEIVTACWRNSFFNPHGYGTTHHTLLASGRAGNVIGGGDWAPDRLIPDIMKAAGQRQTVFIRNPQATRPWQHVLESLSGYLLLGQRLLEARKEFAEAWNFGPDAEACITVQEIIDRARKNWNSIEYEIRTEARQLHEANILKLECSKARDKLRWMPVWDVGKTVNRTISWYRTYYEQGKACSKDDLSCYVADAIEKKISWAVA